MERETCGMLDASGKLVPQPPLPPRAPDPAAHAQLGVRERVITALIKQTQLSTRYLQQQVERLHRQLREPRSMDDPRRSSRALPMQSEPWTIVQGGI